MLHSFSYDWHINARPLLHFVVFGWSFGTFPAFSSLTVAFSGIMIELWHFRQEMERQRLAEWEKQRKAELVQHRQREQEKVLTLKARQEHLNSQLEGMVSFSWPVLCLPSVKAKLFDREKKSQSWRQTLEKLERGSRTWNALSMVWGLPGIQKWRKWLTLKPS